MKLPIVHHLPLICSASFKKIIIIHLSLWLLLQKVEIHSISNTKVLMQMHFGLIKLNNEISAQSIPVSVKHQSCLRFMNMLRTNLRLGPGMNVE